MAEDATNVRVYVGAVYVAPTGSTVPTDGTTALDEAFKNVGYIHEDGFTENLETDISDIVAWGGQTVRKVQTSFDVTYAFTMLETNPVVLAEYYGNFEAGTAGADDVVKIDGKELPHRAWVLTVKDGDNVERIVIPNGQVTERGEVSYTTGEAVGREVTITAFPGTDGVSVTKYVGSETAA